MMVAAGFHLQRRIENHVGTAKCAAVRANQQISLAERIDVGAYRYRGNVELFGEIGDQGASLLVDDRENRARRSSVSNCARLFASRSDTLLFFMLVRDE
jgi:hypothetical protein